MKKILLTGGGGAGCSSIYEQWKHKYDLHFADADILAFYPDLPKSNCHQIPFANDKDFVKRMVNICNDNKINLLIPGVDEELTKCHEIEKLSKNTKILLPHKSFVEDMMDKYKFSQLLLESGLTAPLTFLASELTIIEESFFPAIMKPIYGRGSRGVSVINNKDEASAYLTLSDKKPNKIIIQELAKGDEYTVFISSDANGKLAAIIPVKVGVKRGITIRAETDFDSVIIDYAKKFHEYFKPNCTYNIQLIKTVNNVIYPFEVNPRISTTFALAISTGFDPIETFFNDAKNNLFRSDKKMQLSRHWVNKISKI